MASLCISNLMPEWRYLEESALSNTMKTLALDALESTHPIVRPVDSNQAVLQVFDTIAYLKGKGPVVMNIAAMLL